MTEEEARAEISMRFLIDPSFKVKLSNIDVHFKDIPLNNVEKHTVEIADIGAATLYIIDLKDTDRTTHQHGIAWHVNGRLVGDCSWKGTEHESFLDGRRVEAKRYTFIIFADFLSDVVSKDWTGFNTKNAKYQAANSKIQEFIRERLLEFSKGKREETLFTVKSAYKKELREMTMRSKEKWNAFVEEVQEKCPSIGEKDLVKLAGVLANLELAKSKFNLLHQLHQLDHSNIDELNKVLEEWKIENVKIVLDELQQRMRILDELKIKVASTDTDEVQELQPLFHRGLWIFGPEYETIEYTSNRGMTKVVQDLFKSKKSGTRLRPDFVVLPDSSVGLYSYPTYDSEGGEIGVAKVVVIELKKPGIEIGSEEKNQCWKYIVELYSKGLLQSFTKVDCFALGSRVSPIDGNIRTEKDQAVRIIPLGYDIVIERAKSRLLKLYDRVASAPFLANAKIEPLIKVDEVDADDLQVDFSKEKSFA